MERENLATGSLFILLGNYTTTLQVAKKECEAFFGIGAGPILFYAQARIWKFVASRAKIFPARLYLGKGKKAMRLDKYLKVSRLIKRRTVANEACDAGRVLINDRPAKASANVKQGDIITIQFGNKEVKVEVLDVQETVKKEEAKELFRYI